MLDLPAAFALCLHRSRSRSPPELLAYLGDQPVGIIQRGGQRVRSGAEAGEQRVSPLGEVRRSHGEFARGSHRPLLIEHPTPGMSMEGLHEKTNRTKNAAGDIESVATSRPFTGTGQDMNGASHCALAMSASRSGSG